ncbi:hypothetical protein RHGRI_006033 [Rhododendron griersonianum]|uniref:Uncharacterized protein n=1 Tax=Rhododendron griersonianum TaxID=479676 RepID=A0AAV6LEC8_9ERIC|nr:hypothetical protein RHGRI_006033 [Rhododendron griersonianum]
MLYKKEKEDRSMNQYCKFDSQMLTMFMSSLYLAALISSIVVSIVTSKLGGKLSMLFGGILFCAGKIFSNSIRSKFETFIFAIL